jgi:hypothetical protein
MSHTPGPWYTSGEAGDAFDISTELPDENGECEHVIATVWANRPSLPDAADDARLIAAAPDLLHCVLLFDYACHHGDGECLEAAVAKAKTLIAAAGQKTAEEEEDEEEDE